jgi:hypothetical protein
MNRFYARQFLNRRGHHGGAYVLAVVERSESTDDPDCYVEITLEIADCSRHIELDFPMRTARDRENSVRKARLLAEVIAGFAAAVESESATAAERSRHRGGSRIAPE